MTPKSIEQILKEYGDLGDVNYASQCVTLPLAEIENWLRSAIASAILHAADQGKAAIIAGGGPFCGNCGTLDDYHDALRAYAEKMTKVV